MADEGTHTYLFCAKVRPALSGLQTCANSLCLTCDFAPDPQKTNLFPSKPLLTSVAISAESRNIMLDSSLSRDPGNIWVGLQHIYPIQIQAVYRPVHIRTKSHLCWTNRVITGNVEESASHCEQRGPTLSAGLFGKSSLKVSNKRNAMRSLCGNNWSTRLFAAVSVSQLIKGLCKLHPQGNYYIDPSLPST